MPLCRRTPWLLALLAGCQFDGTGLSSSGGDDEGDRPDAAVVDGPADASGGTTPDAAPPPPIDAPPPPPPIDAREGDEIEDDVAHVPDEAEIAGTADLTLTGEVRIDTTALTISDRPPPAGVVLDAVAQDGGGLELAVLHVDSLDVAVGARVRVVGRRPLVVIAGGAITVSGIVDAGGKRSEPGAAGRIPGEGLGSGGVGVSTAEFSDSGGGGAGYGFTAGAGGASGCTPGPNGGSCTATGGKAGPVYGNPDLLSLQGGSGGGAAPPVQGCALKAAGAGGGAVQLYAVESITVSGAIGAGGGGGGGGARCDRNWAAGSGGGSGGAIYLQSPTVTISGPLAANGGGGGGGAGDASAGGDGSDGGLDALRAAGGPSGGRFAARGGSGGARTGAATAGERAFVGGNAGGGGGAAGRIAIRVKRSPPPGSISSPTADVKTY